MTAQVIFLNHNYLPDYSEQMRLENLQDYLSYSNQAYYRERSQMPEDFVKAVKNEIHKEARKRLGIISEAKDLR